MTGLKRLIFLTNDDGIGAPGLQCLHRQILAAADWQVLVVAPDGERSGAGHSVSLRRPVYVSEHNLNSLPGRAWAVAGTPADCVKVGLAALTDAKPDLVLSGINRGANLGTDVFCSGTVSAAVQGAILGIPSLAISLNAYEGANYGLAARVAVRLAGLILCHGLPPGTMLNVNVPDRPAAAIPGFALTRLGSGAWLNQVQTRVDADGRSYYWLASDPSAVANETGTDHLAMAEGKVSITPIHFDLTHPPALDLLGEWDLGAAWRALG